MVPPRRKKWTEAEEKTLIRKYGEMVSKGTLSKMRTREKKFRPIALYVNSVHHARDPVAFPWQWTWKDVSTKVQNMRHQYLLVKQKIKRPDAGALEEFDWLEGITHWANFLLYKEVFGDVSASYGVGNGNELTGAVNEDCENGGQLLVDGSEMELVDFGSMVNSGDGDFTGIDVVENVVISLDFDYEGDEVEAAENYGGNNHAARVDGNDGPSHENEKVDPSSPISRRKRMSTLKGSEKNMFGFLSNQLRKLREMESQMERREMDREQERKRQEIVQIEREREWERKLEKTEKEREDRDKAREKLRRQRIQKWEAMEMDSEQERKRRREEDFIQAREWEDMINMQRSESRKRIDGMLNQHREDMGQVQTRLLHEQQNLTSQLLGMIAQWTGHPAGLTDHTSASNHYFSQMMQNLHHVNAMVHSDTRVDGDTQEDQFIVDG